MSLIEPRYQGRMSPPSCSSDGHNAKDGMTGRRARISAAAIGAAGWLAALSDALYAAASASWMQFGACQEEDPELFFPVGVRGPAVSQADAAKAVCGRCAVRLECLSFALRTRAEDGIWGGTTWEERRTIVTTA